MHKPHGVTPGLHFRSPGGMPEAKSESLEDLVFNLILEPRRRETFSLSQDTQSFFLLRMVQRISGLQT